MNFNIFLRRYKFLLFRLKNATEQSASNPRDEVSGDSDGITTLPEKQYSF